MGALGIAMLVKAAGSRFCTTYLLMLNSEASSLYRRLTTDCQVINDSRMRFSLDHGLDRTLLLLDGGYIQPTSLELCNGHTGAGWATPVRPCH